MEMVISKEKKELRQKSLERLLSLTKDEIKRRSKNVESQLSNLSVYKEAKVIMAYYPLRGEVDVLELVRKDIGSKRFCFPVMDLKKKSLHIFEVADLDAEFVSGPFGIREPDTKKTKKVDAKEIDMVIVPGLAFDYDKNRLGRGVGFYDRFLEGLAPNIKKVAIAFKLQILQNLPVNLSWDQKVDLVVSENFII